MVVTRGWGGTGEGWMRRGQSMGSRLLLDGNKKFWCAMEQ
jgi:hypothetical protein